MAESPQSRTDVIKEEVFFWSDAQVLQNKKEQEDIDRTVKEHWETYFSDGKNLLPNLSAEAKDEAKQAFERGPPFQNTIFDRLAKEIFDAVFASSYYPAKFYFFASACIYRKRMSGESMDLPDLLFDQVQNEIDHPDWKVFHVKDEGVVSRRAFPLLEKGYCIKCQTVMKCPPEDVFDILWDVKRRAEWEESILETRVVESISPVTDVVYVQALAPVVKTDYCMLQGKKVMPDGTIFVVGCSVDHSQAPITKKWARGNCDLFAHRMRPKDEGTCSFTAVYVSKSTKVAAFFMKFDFIARKTCDGAFNLQKLVEGKGKKDKKEKKEKKEKKDKKEVKRSDSKEIKALANE